MSAPNLTGFYRDGFFRRRVVTISTASTGYNVSPNESGTLFVAGEVTTQFVRLPRVSSKRLGLTYDFSVAEQTSGADNFNIVTNLDSSARISGLGTSGSTGTAAQSARPASSVARAFARFTAVSSVLWTIEQAFALQVNSSFELLTTQVAAGGWSTGTTST